MARGRPRKNPNSTIVDKNKPVKLPDRAIMPKRNHSSIDEEHQKKLMEIVEKYPNTTLNELMIVGIEFIYDTLLNSF